MHQILTPILTPILTLLKGANLCEMYRLKLPIPIGFVITTESCIDFTRETKEKGVSELNPHLVEQYVRAVHEMEKQTGKAFGLDDSKSIDKHVPLLLSVRSGAAV